MSNGVEATGARFVNLSQFDAASGIISGVVWAVSQAELAERALALMRRLVPGFEIETATVDVAANPWLERIHFDGETVVAPFREIVEGTVHPGVALAARQVLGLRWTVSVPLRVEDVVVGSLAFHFTAEPPRRTQRSAEAFARQVILTLQNARLSVELGRQIEELHRSRRLVSPWRSGRAARSRSCCTAGSRTGGSVAWSRLGLTEELWASDPSAHATC